MTITVRMPMARSCAKRSVSPSLTTSLRCTTPSTRAAPSARLCATTSGVPPEREISVTRSWSSPRAASSGCAPSSASHATIAEPAPLRICEPSCRSSPDIRVCAVKGTTSPAASCSRLAPRSRARSTIEEPSGVGSARDESAAACTSSSSATPVSGTNAVARRLPYVMVPVLSSSRVVTSPAASTARPDMASTLRCTSRSMPAMPIAESSAPMVVGIRHTSSAISTVTLAGLAG